MDILQEMELLQNNFLDISLVRWVYFIGILVLTFIVQKIFIAFLGRRVLKMAQQTDTQLDELLLKAILKPLNLTFFVFGLFLAAQSLGLPKEVSGFEVHAFFRKFLMIGLTVALTWFLNNSVNILRYYLEAVTEKTDTKLDDQLVPIITKALKITVTVMAVLIVLQNFGYSVTSILASLGIGGVAFALASKDTVENIFGSIVVFSDKPFQLHDWIKIGDVEGTVEEVGVRSTRIRRFDKALVTLPNSKLTTTAIVNFSKMEKRRIKTTVSIAYESTADQVRAMVNGIREIIASDDRFDQEFSLVRFTEMGDSALGIFIYCFTKTTDWALHLEIKEDFYLKIMDLAQKHKVEFAYPTQTLYVRKGEDSQ